MKDLGRKLTEEDERCLNLAKEDPSKLLPACKEFLCCSNKHCEREKEGKCIKGVGIISAISYMSTAGLCDTAIKAAFTKAYGEEEGEKLYEQFGYRPRK